MSHCGRSPVASEGHPYDIETECRSSGLVVFQVQASGAHDAGSLASIHRFKRMPAFLTRARADLDEDKDASIFRHQVQFSLGAAPVSLDDAIATRFQQGGSQSLGACTNRRASRVARAPIPGVRY